jgi:hypothetical protein
MRRWGDDLWEGRLIATIDTNSKPKTSERTSNAPPRRCSPVIQNCERSVAQLVQPYLHEDSMERCRNRQAHCGSRTNCSPKSRSSRTEVVFLKQQPQRAERLSVIWRMFDANLELQRSSCRDTRAGGKPVKDFRGAWRNLCVRAGVGPWTCEECNGSLTAAKCKGRGVHKVAVYTNMLA